MKSLLPLAAVVGALCVFSTGVNASATATTAISMSGTVTGTVASGGIEVMATQGAVSVDVGGDIVKKSASTITVTPTVDTTILSLVKITFIGQEVIIDGLADDSSSLVVNLDGTVIDINDESDMTLSGSTANNSATSDITVEGEVGTTSSLVPGAAVSVNLNFEITATVT